MWVPSVVVARSKSNRGHAGLFSCYFLSKTMLLQSEPGAQQTHLMAPQTQSRPLLVHMPQPLAAGPWLACD